MNTLYQLLKDFDGTKAKSIDELTQSFGVIAQRVLYGGHFLIKGLCVAIHKPLNDI